MKNYGDLIDTMTSVMCKYADNHDVPEDILEVLKESYNSVSAARNELCIKCERMPNCGGCRWRN